MNFVLFIRTYRTSSTVIKSSNVIRNEFLNYFKNDLGHTFIRSSPVTAFNDHTIAFTNAGMCQFKGVFLNYYDPPAEKVTNSQKCIRVSGKHNDLNIVGNDSYHHTFFEMLGNWSFGSYFKEEACHYAWDLLTKHYGINKEFLYVTYFGGNEELELKPDLECKDIWLSIGVPKERVLPFGLEENFWEMAKSGPCGPATEIHVDHTKQLINRSMDVNKGLTNLTELWNIVFIQYTRLENGTITPLSKQYVDTGMGFERLVTFLQGKDSNYDTDIFQPLFQTIQKYTNVKEYGGKFDNVENKLDNAYRIIADHSRMITVALADGTVPEKSNKLRRIMRTSFDISEDIFKKEGLVKELSYIVAENLGDTYPELRDNLGTVQKIITFEEELYRRVQSTASKQWKKILEKYPQAHLISDHTIPGLSDGYKYLQDTIKTSKITNGQLPGDVAFKLYDTYGLNVKTIQEMAETESLHFDEKNLQKELNDLKNRSRFGLESSSMTILKNSVKIFKENGVPTTDDTFTYNYIFDKNILQFPEIQSKILGVIMNGNVIAKENETIINNNEQLNEDNIGIILDKTLFYSLEYDQVSDKGSIYFEDRIFNVDKAKSIEGYVIHYGKFVESDLKEGNKELKIGDKCRVSINPEFRIGLMKHHTGAHLLNACMKRIMSAAYPRYSTVLPNSLKFQYNSFGEKLSLEQLKEIENVINNVIKADVSVTTEILNSWQLLTDDSIILVPGHIYRYKDNRVVKFENDNLKSKEPCHGTHVPNTGMLEYFCFLNYHANSAINITLLAAVGPRAISAKLAGEELQLELRKLESILETKQFVIEKFNSSIKQIKNKINDSSSMLIPYVVRKECLMKLDFLCKNVQLQRNKAKV